MNEINEIIDKVFHKEVFKAHIDKYGFDKQITVLGEECCELAKEIFKIKRFRENNPNLDFYWLHDRKSEEYTRFVEEYIDVYILIKQFEPYINETVAYDIIHEKYKKAYERVKELMI